MTCNNDHPAGSPDNKEYRFVKFLGGGETITVTSKLYGIGDEANDSLSDILRNMERFVAESEEPLRRKSRIHKLINDHIGCFIVISVIFALLGIIGPFLIK